MTRALIRDAVLANPALSTAGLLERLFTFSFHRLVYNQIWEDPRVDLEALAPTRASRIVTIASAGCNVLNYLAADPAAVTAVDLNPAHLALTRLKQTALRHLPDYEPFHRFFAEAGDPRNAAAYDLYVAPHLDPDSRAWWDGHRLPLGRRRIDHYFSDNLFRHGLMGRFIGFGHFVARRLGGDPARMLSARSPADQRRLFDEAIAPAFDHWLVRALCRLPVLVWGLGIPPAQFEAMRTASGGALHSLYRERVRRLACDFPMTDNYFAWQAFGRRYPGKHEGALPDYLSPRHYDEIRSRLARVHTHLVSMTDFLAVQPAGAHDRFVLLDAQDWMSPRQIEALWGEMTRVSPPGGRIIFRTAGPDSPIERHLSERLRSQWTYEAERSRALHERDRSAIYGGFHLYVKRGQS
jgi:S-adenosylmethionine-diacylglycerol 3-amino-3-carboxypropyl transferase